MLMKYEETDLFARDFKKLLRKFRSLEEDLEIAKKNAIELFHIHHIDNNSVFEIKGARNTTKLQFYKLKKFSCHNLKGKGSKSGIRIVYAYFSESQKAVLLQIYFKGHRENEDRKRIKSFREEHC
jgi:hypothetical protein